MKDKQTKTYKTTIGGQALIEGIMMRGPKSQAMVVRTPDGLVSKTEELKFIKDKYPILGWPFVRGVVNFGGSMVAGVRAIFFSVEQLPEDEQANQESKIDKWLESKFSKDEKGQKALMTIVAAFAIVLSIGLFILLPTLLAGLLGRVITNRIWLTVAEGAIRVIIFLGYIILVGKTPDIKRVFRYHGAEHKTIFCYEAKLPLTVENVRIQRRQHPRCGTSFLFVVMIISILVFSVITWTNPILRIVFRLLLLPVVVAVSYEFNRLVGRHDNWLTRALSAPGRWIQNFTVYEPDDSMIEVAIAAMEFVIPERAGDDEW